MLIGSPMLAAALAIVANNRPRALLSLPAYVLFPALRSWYTLESALDIPIMSTSTRIQTGRDPWPQSPPPTLRPKPHEKDRARGDPRLCSGAAIRRTCQHPLPLAHPTTGVTAAFGGPALAGPEQPTFRMP